MPCSSCGGRNSRTIAQAHAQRVAGRTALPGSTPDLPLILGDDDESEVKRVRVLRSVNGLVVGSSKYVRGTDVDDLISGGSLLDVTNIGQRQRQWRVGPYTYTDYSQAMRVAAAKGLEPIEVA